MDNEKITYKDVEYYKIPGFNNIYFISKSGVVLSVARTIVKECGIKMNMKTKIKSQFISNAGYYATGLSIGYETIHTNIHSLLAKVFIDSDYLNKKLVVNHIDGNKLNNNLNNLEVVSYAKNNLHALDNDLKRGRGSNHHNAILNEDIASEIWMNKNKLSRTQLSKLYNVSTDVIRGVQRRRCWTHVTDKINKK